MKSNSIGNLKTLKIDSRDIGFLEGGKIVGNYLIRKFIGTGGMGKVYLVEISNQVNLQLLKYYCLNLQKMTGLSADLKKRLKSCSN